MPTPKAALKKTVAPVVVSFSVDKMFIINLIFQVWGMVVHRGSVVTSLKTNSNQLVHSPLPSKPSCLQATLPSFLDHEPSQMVPQVLLKQISTRPSYWLAPFTRRRSVSLQRPKWTTGLIIPWSTYCRQWLCIVCVLFFFAIWFEVNLLGPPF